MRVLHDASDDASYEASDDASHYQCLRYRAAGGGLLSFIGEELDGEVNSLSQDPMKHLQK
jgi:hypothetical protein